MVKAYPAPQVGRQAKYVSYVLGIGAAGLAVAQMVSFEEFVAALQDYQLAPYIWTVVLGLLLISLEVFAVPFLLRLSLSRLAWACSAVCALLLPLAWTLMTVVALVLNHSVPNAGYVGGFIKLPVGGLVLVLNLVWLTATWVGFGRLGGRAALRLR